MVLHYGSPSRLIGPLIKDFGTWFTDYFHPLPCHFLLASSMSVKTWSSDLQDRLSKQISTPRTIHSLVFSLGRVLPLKWCIPFPAISLNYFRYTDSSAALSHRLLSSRFAPWLSGNSSWLPPPQLRLHEPFLVPNAASTLSHLVLLSSCYMCWYLDSDGPECHSSPCIITRTHCNLFNNVVGHKDIVFLY